jgi:hypothetical protein
MCKCGMQSAGCNARYASVIGEPFFDANPHQGNKRSVASISTSLTWSRRRETGIWRQILSDGTLTRSTVPSNTRTGRRAQLCLKAATLQRRPASESAKGCLQIVTSRLPVTEELVASARGKPFLSGDGERERYTTVAGRAGNSRLNDSRWRMTTTTNGESAKLRYRVRSKGRGLAGQSRQPTFICIEGTGPIITVLVAPKQAAVRYATPVRS